MVAISAFPRGPRQKPKARLSSPDRPLLGAETGMMRTLLIAAACFTLLATTLAQAPASAQSNCAAQRSSCVAACNDRETSQARFQACANRCSIQFCQDIPIACRPGDQSVCTNGFNSCNNGCDALAAIPSGAAIQNQTACQNRCCNQFKVCLGQRSCDVSGITCQ